MTAHMDNGWSFDDALARTSDPQLWDRHQAEEQEPRPTNLSADLRRSLNDQLLEKIGTKLVAAVPKPAGGPNAWTPLARPALEQKITRARTDEVRFFPPLKAPNAIDLLSGQGLGEAFRQYVLEDPEVTMVLKRNGTPNLFEGGKGFGPNSHYGWPLEATVSLCEYRLSWDGLLSWGSAAPRPTYMVSALSEVLADRIAVFRGLLVSGEIRAFGLSSVYNDPFVPVRQWMRKNLAIEVANGDLCEEDNRGNLTPLWTGVELQATVEASSLPAQPPAQPTRGNRKRSPEGQEIERIIKEHRIDADKVGSKAAAAAVASHMRNPPLLENAIRALEKQVARISKAVNGTT